MEPNVADGVYTVPDSTELSGLVKAANQSAAAKDKMAPTWTILRTIRPCLPGPHGDAPIADIHTSPATGHSNLGRVNVAFRPNSTKGRDNVGKGKA